MAHALFFDQTHDNPSYKEKRTVLDMLPSAALVRQQELFVIDELIHSVY